jgi:hypothetical protein
VIAYPHGQKSTCISTHLCIKWFTEHFLTHKASETVILPLDGHRAYFNSPLLLQTAVENTVTIILPPSQYTHTLQPLSKCFWREGGGWGAVKSCFKNEAAAWNSTWYCIPRLTGFASSKAASMGVSVSAFEYEGIHSFNRNRVPVYLFSTSSTSETILWKQHLQIWFWFSYPLLAVNESKNVLPITAEPSLRTMSIYFLLTLPLEELLPPDFRRRLVRCRKYRENIQLKKIATLNNTTKYI